MAFDAIDTAEFQVKKPVTRSWAQKIKDSLDFLNGRIGTLELQGMQNGSFEIDSDADGVPDNWSRTLYPGGQGALDTVAPAHGSKSIKFTHPGGSGNGGGKLTSDYIPIASCHLYMLDFIHWVSGTLRCLVEVSYYDKSKVFVSTITAYDKTAATPTVPTYFIGGFTPPATACFMKIIITGGHSSAAGAGAAWFDSVRINPSTWDIGYSMPFTIPEGTTVGNVWTDVAGCTVITPILLSPAILSFVAELKTNVVDITTARMRFRIGTAYSNEASVTTDWAAQSFSLPFESGSGGEAVVYLQLNRSGEGHTAFGRKSSAAATLRFNL